VVPMMDSVTVLLVRGWLEGGDWSRPLRIVIPTPPTSPATRSHDGERRIWLNYRVRG
jgi:hypothetical protein